MSSPRPGSSAAAAFGAHYSMESLNTATRRRNNEEKFDPLHFNLIAQLSPSTPASKNEILTSHTTQAKQAAQGQGLPSAPAMMSKNNNNNEENSSHWIDFSADNDFQQMEDMFAQQQQYSDTSSISMGSNVDLGESFTEELDYDINLDSELVDDEQALQTMKDLLGGNVSSRSKQELLAAASQAKEQHKQIKSPKQGTLNQRLADRGGGSLSPKPPRGSEYGDLSIHSDSRRGSITQCTATTFTSSFSSGMSLSDENNNNNNNNDATRTEAPPGEATTTCTTKEKKESSSSGGKSKKKSGSKGKESSSGSDRKSSSGKDKKKKKRSHKSKNENGGGSYSAYLPLDDDGSAIVEDAVCPDGTIRFDDTTLSNKIKQLPAA